MNRTEILDIAERLITGDREHEHGKPSDTFSRIADLWSAYIDVHIKPHDVAVMMGLLKAARISANPGNGDNFVDAVGYFALAAELASVSGGSDGAVTR